MLPPAALASPVAPAAPATPAAPASTATSVAPLSFTPYSSSTPAPPPAPPPRARRFSRPPLIHALSPLNARPVANTGASCPALTSKPCAAHHAPAHRRSLV